MPRPTRPPARRPATDPTSVALITLAEPVLGRHFANPDHRDAYEFLFSPGSGRRNRAAMSADAPLEVWEMGEGGMLVLMAAPGKQTFAVIIDQQPLGALVVATYDPANGKMTNATVEQTVGKKTGILALVRGWNEDLIQGDFFDSEDDPDDPDADLDETQAPAEPTEQDAATVHRIAEALAARRGNPLPLDAVDPDRAWLDENPQALWAILDRLIAAFQAADRDPALAEAFRWLLVMQLEQIRYRQEAGYAWAEQMLDSYQNRLLALSEGRLLTAGNLLEIATTLKEAKIPIDPALSEALMIVESAEAIDPATLAHPLEGLRAMLDELAQQVDSPFDVMEGISGAFGAAPTELRAFIAHEFAHSAHALLRDAVPLMLLDDTAEIRQAAIAALEQTAAPETFSPATLRRTIAVRNWLPEAERAGVDRVIRAARTKGVVCAQWPLPPDLTILASSIDGSGAQSVIATTRTGKTGIFCGVLLKQGFGIRDTWSEEHRSRREINAMLAELRRQTPSTEVEPAYLGMAVQHHIAIGLTVDHLPGPALLDIAERTGGNDWQDRGIDVATEIETLFTGLAPADRTLDRIAASLRRSGGWLAREDFAESWFEDTPEIRRLSRLRPADRAKTLHTLLTEVLPKYRNVWAERFLLMALWARAAKDRIRNERMGDFVILAHQLAGDRPLTDIPIMAGIAESSIRAARSGR